MEFDLFHPSLLADPYPTYKRLREEAPLYFDEGRQLWFTSRYKETADFLSQPEIFSSEEVFFESTLIGADDPDHAFARNVVRKAFSEERMALWRAQLHRIITPLLKRIAEKRNCEFMAEFADFVPTALIMSYLGIDEEKYTICKEWAKTITDTASTLVTPEKRAEDFSAFTQFFERHALELTHESGIPAAELTGEGKLNAAQMRDVCMLLMIAGSETTTNLLGNAIIAILREAGLYERLKGGPRTRGRFIDEVLRYDAPVQRVSRRTTREVELLGKTIPAGAYVIGILGSANRDPDAFPDPDQFRSDRSPNSHLSFGKGIHACLGARLAKLEADMMLEAILEHLPEPTLAMAQESIAYQESFELRGPSRLPLEFPATG